MRGMWPASTAGKPSATELRARVYTAMPVCVYSGVLSLHKHAGVRTFTPPCPASYSCNTFCNICCEPQTSVYLTPDGLPDALTLALARPRHGPQEASEAGALTCVPCTARLFVTTHSLASCSHSLSDTTALRDLHSPRRICGAARPRSYPYPPTLPQPLTRWRRPASTRLASTRRPMTSRSYCSTEVTLLPEVSLLLEVTLVLEVTQTLTR